MKWITEWYGIQLIAETDNDKKLLEDLRSRLSKPEYCYEEGEITVADKVTDYACGSDKNELPNIKSKYVLRFQR